MAIFFYKAIDADGRLHNARVEAANDIELEIRLQKQGLELINARPLAGDSGRSYRNKVSRQDLIHFCLHLEYCLRAGVTIIEALKDLTIGTDRLLLRDIYSSLVDAIESGHTLSQALRKYPGVFDSLFCGLIETGEQSGELTEVLKRLGENLTWLDEQARQIKRAFIYPAIVSLVVLLVIAVLMIYLVPQLTQFMQMAGGHLPLHTRVLINVSYFFKNYWYLVIALPIVVGIAARFLLNASHAFRVEFDRRKLTVPIAGSILHKMIMARFSGFFSLMYGSGITIIESLQAAENIAGNLFVREKFLQITRQVSDGLSLSESFANAKLFPPLVLRMVRVGENTGSLKEAFDQVNYFYTRDVRESVSRLQIVLEPILTIMLAAVVLWVVVSVLGPVYDIITKLPI